MNIKLTKEEFKLLIDMYDEALQMVSIKKYFKTEIPKKYNFNQYVYLRNKLRNCIINTRYEDEIEKREMITKVENIGIKDNFIEVCEKIGKKEILITYYKELLENEEFANETEEFAKKLKEGKYTFINLK